MSFSIVVALAALGLACVAALALWRPHELWLGDAQPHRGRRRPAEPAALCAPWRGWWDYSRARSNAPPAQPGSPDT